MKNFAGGARRDDRSDEQMVPDGEEAVLSAWPEERPLAFASPSESFPPALLCKLYLINCFVDLYILPLFLLLLLFFVDACFLVRHGSAPDADPDVPSVRSAHCAHEEFSHREIH